MKKNVLAPVIENLLCAARETLIGAGFEANSLRKAVKAVKQYKKQLEKDDLISLFVESAGESEVGIGRERIEIKIPRVYIAPDFRQNFPGTLSLRKEMKELFADACSTLFETPIGRVNFEDECADCGKILNDAGKCETEDCPNLFSKTCHHF